ncbi:MAG TPA: cbb3-type cytochrome c oxidase subunit II [Woeseiaceae bacterium]|nr:cbb3-type cytochrome c oxidase subunit II [Woeseiaceae bacterium]
MRLDTNHRALVAAAGLGYLFLSLIIAVLPAFDMQKVQGHPGVEAPTPEVLLGRKLYMEEGCGFCHTQFVRDLELDQPYGRGSVAADYADESPPMLGTQRTGPDLADVGSRQPSEMWNLIHLYNPRAVAPHSVMPAYPWFFELQDKANGEGLVVPVPAPYAPEGKVIIASDEAIALVRYLQWLKQVKVP